MPTLTIDGKPVTLFGYIHTADAAQESHTEFPWIVQFGVNSPIVEWELDPDTATYVLSRKEISIHAEGFGFGTLDVKRVFVVGATGSKSKRRTTVQLGDVRRTLKYTNPVAALNVRAQSGNNSLNGFDGLGNFIRQIPQFVYRLYSVNPDGTPAGPQDVVRTVMNLSAQKTTDWVLDAPPRSTLVPNDMMLFDRGDVSVVNMLGTIGGLDLYVDPADGLMHVTNRLMGDEKDEIEKRLPVSGEQDIEGWAKIVWRTEEHNRPSSFNIKFDPEIEFRSDYVEGDVGTRDKDAAWSECVAEVMEYRPGFYQATSVDVSTPRQCLPGEYLEINQYLKTMPNGPLVSSLPLSLLQAGFNNTNLIYGILGDGQIPDPGEEARIKSALGNYRQTFRLNRRRVSRCRPGSIRAVMAAVSDAETGERKPSDVYVEHCVIPTLEVALGNSTNALQGWNRDSFPPLDSTANGSEKVYTDQGGATPSLLSSMKVAPFECFMVNSDAGIYGIRARPDYNDERQTVVPCRILEIPTLDYTAANNSLGLFFWDQAAVSVKHRMSVVLSAIPGVGEYNVPITVAQAAARLGTTVTAGIAPVMEVRIGLFTARIPYDDTRRQLIDDAFAGTLANTENDPLKTLKPANLKDLQDYATGFCAAQLANYLPHYEGNQAIPLDPTMKPVGSVHTVVHKIGSSGLATTTINCLQVRDPFIADHFLSASTLAIVRGRVTS